MNDEDCGEGLFCDTTLAQPTCMDIDECDPEYNMFAKNGRKILKSVDGLEFCGDETICSNSIGSFSCSCSSDRFVAWQEYTGCRDKDECAEVAVKQ